MTVWCRPETAEDEPFVRRVLVEAVAEELGARTWPEPLREHLLELQYRGRRAGVGSLPSASEIIVADGEDVGWLLVADLEQEIRIVEIVVLSLFRGRGVGSAVLGSILTRAGAAAKRVRLVVTSTNGGAIRLYQRLGFRTIDRDEVQQWMEWTAPSRPI